MKYNKLEDIIDITCGILFNRTFKILDKRGEIADTILYDNSYFPPDYFNTIESEFAGEKSLRNDKLGHYIKLSSNNLIYSHSIQENFDEEFKLFQDRINNFLLVNVVKKHSLTVNRIGVVYGCAMSEKQVDNFKSNYFKNLDLKITDFRFSRKESTREGKLENKTDNFINKIYSISLGNTNNKNIVFDYQKHFIPVTPTPDVYLKNFFSDSHNCLNKEILELEA